jgi:sugar phosphate isomerase/epimerase
MIALSTGSLYTYGTARVFELAAQIGFDGIEVLIDHRPDTFQPAYLRHLSSAYSLPIVALHSPFAADVPGWPDDQLERLQRTVALAQVLEVPVVVTHLPYKLAVLVVRWYGALKGHLALPLPWFRQGDYYRLLLNGGLIEIEAQSGVHICVENMPVRRFWGLPLPLYWFNRPERMIRFSHVTLDTTHIGTWGWSLLEAYEPLAERIAHVHLSNYDGREHRAPFDGHLPLDALLRRLVADGYPGAISIESNPQALEAEDKDKCRVNLEQALAFCRQHVDHR